MSATSPNAPQPPTKEYNVTLEGAEKKVKFVCLPAVKLKANRSAISFDLKTIFGFLPEKIVIKMSDSRQTNAFQICALKPVVEGETAEEETVKVKPEDIGLVSAPPENPRPPESEQWVVDPNAPLPENDPNGEGIMHGNFIPMHLHAIVELMEGAEIPTLPAKARGEVTEYDMETGKVVVQWNYWGEGFVEPLRTTWENDKWQEQIIVVERARDLFEQQNNGQDTSPATS